MNKSLQEGETLAQEIVRQVAQTHPSCRVILAPPYHLLASVAKITAGSPVITAAQDCSAFASGAYTGEVSAPMIASCGAQAVIIGHSERRQYHHEDAPLLTEKIRRALASGLEVIYCVGENKEEREQNRHLAVVQEQLESVLKAFSAAEFARIIVAYEPVWAIGTGLTATPEQAQDMHKHIRAVLANLFGPQAAADTSLLYGGSCNPQNAATLFAGPDVDGGLIGGAALVTEKFMAIVATR